MKAIVIKTTGKYYTVKMENNEIVQCRLKGRFRIAGIKSTNPIVVGDHVEVDQESELWTITSLYDRRNQIVRRSVNLSKKTHVIAANIDQAILIVTLDSPITTTGFIDRFLVAAYSYDVDVVILFNKIDLLDRKLKLAQEKLQEVYERIHYRCLALSVINDDLSVVIDLMKDKVNMIAGHSGVGKSTLINRLQPGLNINTQEISKTHKQGQHTTTFSELYDLDFGASIIDTPGIKGFGLVKIEPNEIRNYFPDFLAMQEKCRFYNCIHKDEPDCAVKLACKNGSLAESRYQSYINMLNQEESYFRTNSY